MHLPDTLELHGHTFRAIRTRRGGRVRVYRSDALFLKLGDVEREREVHRRLLKRGAPLADIVYEGNHNGAFYYIERSLGDEQLGELFRLDMDQSGAIGEQRFGEFLDVVSRFASAQLETRLDTHEPSAFASGIALNELALELPVWHDRIHRRFDDAIAALFPFPYVESHGDFNAHNMFPAGVIDLDDAFPAPAGYDLITALVHTEYFAPDPSHHFMQRYTFTPEQRTNYLKIIDSIYRDSRLPPPSAFLPDFEYCRAVWLCVAMQDKPNMRAFRLERLKERFLAGHS